MPHDTGSDQAKSNLPARLSQEIRSPLNAIIRMCAIARSTDDRGKISACIERINDTALRLLGMASDVVDIANIEAGEMTLSCAEFNFVQMLQKAVAISQSAIDAKKINMVLELDPALPETIISDEQRLTKILDNLLSNAVKFTPAEGTITLGVKKLKEENSTCALSFTISDTGAGISSAAIKSIFTLFEQPDGGIERKFSGEGVGLAISASIIKLMGGSISVDSEPGKGTVFGFEIDVEKGDNASVSARNEQHSGQKSKLAGKTIILAEDVEINREIVLSLLEDSGISIECAENGKAALEKYKASPSKYSLILMDTHMPEMDGLEATRQIRAFEKELASSSEGASRAVPIIAMISNVFRDGEENCLSAGMTAHLGKPIDIVELNRELERFLR